MAGASISQETRSIDLARAQSGCQDALADGGRGDPSTANSQDYALAFALREAPKVEAFTLVELLVVIVIIGILASLLIPAVVRTQESGRSTGCLSNLHQIGVALQLYAQDNQNILPVMRDKSTNAVSGTNSLPSPDVVLTNYLGVSQVWRCPSDKAGIYESTGSSYSWNSLLNGQNADQLTLLNLTSNPHQIPVMFDKQGFHIARGAAYAVNYLYADGHLKNLIEGP
jgi:prepilin-type N-terminal cleavage/methylation domain-containing protein/prepilin-type processing-associated H-X9-DG protein